MMKYEMFELEINPNDEVYRKAIINSYLQKFTPSKKWIKIAQLIASILFFIAYLFKNNVTNLVVSCILFVSLALQYLFEYLTKLYYQKHLTKTLGIQSYTVKISQNGLSFDYEHAKSDIKWEYIQYFEEFNELFLFYPIENDSSPILLLLTSINEKEQIKQLIYSKIPKK